MGVEVRQTLERDYDIMMTMREIRQLSINKLRELADSKQHVANGDVLMSFIGKNENMKYCLVPQTPPPCLT